MRINTILFSLSLAFILFSGCTILGGDNSVAEVTQDNSSTEDIVSPVKAPSLTWSVNECRSFGNAKVCLEDISTEVDSDNKSYAMVAITYGSSSGAEDKIAPGTQKTLNGITVSVIDTPQGGSTSSPTVKMNLSGSYVSSSTDQRALRKDSCINYSSSRICLLDLSREMSTGPAPALVSILGAEGSRMGELKIAVNSYGVAEIDGSNVAIHVTDTAAGMSNKKTWARITVNETSEAVPDSKFETIYKGSCKTGYVVRVCLSDISMDENSGKIAVFDIYDSSGALSAKKSLIENSSDVSVVSGRMVKIETGEMGYGLSSDIGWVKGAITIITN
jgi:hypothetical protein